VLAQMPFIQGRKIDRQALGSLDAAVDGPSVAGSGSCRIDGKS
jgi:hypothetical protein